MDQQPATVALLEGADCGTATHKYLSFATAQQCVERNHPREVSVCSVAEDGMPILSYTPYSCCRSRTGYHRVVNCCAGRRNAASAASDFAKFGGGVALYFKFLKFASILFLIMSACSLPALVLFSSGGQYAASGSGTSDSSLVGALATVTMGNLGEAQPVCGSAWEADTTLSISCPNGTSIGRVEALYGAPSGQCACPEAQLPSPQCTGVVQGSSCTPASSFCFQSSARIVQMPSGDRWGSGACCAAHSTGGKPDFSALDFNADPVCAGDVQVTTAIVAGLCVGRPACSLSTLRNSTQTWIGSSDYGTTCAGAMLVGPSTGTCAAQLGGSISTPFASGPALSRCGASPRYNGVSGARLVVVARCYVTTLDPRWVGWGVGIAGVGFDKEYAAIIVLAFDFASAVIFLLAAWLLRVREDDEDKARLSAADYTILIPEGCLPPHESIVALDVLLRRHFEEVLSPAKCVMTQVRASVQSVVLYVMLSPASCVTAQVLHCRCSIVVVGYCMF